MTPSSKLAEASRLITEVAKHIAASTPTQPIPGFTDINLSALAEARGKVDAVTATLPSIPPGPMRSGRSIRSILQV